MGKSAFCLAALFVVGLSGFGLADELELHDGRVLVGYVKAETGTMVLFEVQQDGIVAQMTFRASEIKRITRKELPPPVQPQPQPTVKPPVKPPQPPPQPEPAGPKYFMVPLRGVVGQGILADKLKAALDACPKDPETVVVFELDSPGGMLGECEKVIRLLAEHRQRRTIAHVKSAYSAAAIIALTCDEIYMQSTASIGAAVAYQETPWGRTAVEEKFQSVWRALCRTSAEVGGHNPLIAEAMVDRNMQLRIVEKEGKPGVEQFLRMTEEDLRKGNILTPAGKLLTMTAREAVGCGLAVGIADSLDDVGRAAGLAGWRLASKAGIDLMAAHEAECKDAEKKIKQHTDNGEKCWRLAEANAPESGHYTVDMATGKFTPQSRQEWVARSVKCFNHLKECEGHLEQIIVIAGKYPLFEPESEWARSMKTRVSAKRQAIRDNASRQGL